MAVVDYLTMKQCLGGRQCSSSIFWTGSYSTGLSHTSRQEGTSIHSMHKGYDHTLPSPA